jgi:hypothetical protein
METVPGATTPGATRRAFVLIFTGPAPNKLTHYTHFLINTMLLHPYRSNSIYMNRETVRHA